MNLPRLTDIWSYRADATTLHDRNVLISGATGALGNALAHACAAAGATVVLLGRDVELLEQCYDRLLESGAAEPAILVHDLESDDDTAWDNVTASLQSLPRLDGVVTAHAILGQLSPLALADTRQLRRVIAVNLIGTTLLIKACMPALRLSDDASVVFTLDPHTRAYWSGYGIAQAGTAGLAGILAHEWEPPENETRNVRINAVAPGAFHSRLRRAAYPAENARELPTPESRVAPYLYLLGKDSAGVNNLVFNAAGESAKLSDSNRTVAQ